MTDKSITLLASAARTVETNSSDQQGYKGKMLVIIVDVSAITDTPSITPTLEVKDSVSGNYFVAWRAAVALAATGTSAYLFALGGSGSAGLYTEAVNIRRSRTWRFQMEVADADSATYSVSAEVLA